MMTTGMPGCFARRTGSRSRPERRPRRRSIRARSKDLSMAALRPEGRSGHACTDHPSVSKAKAMVWQMDGSSSTKRHFLWGLDSVSSTPAPERDIQVTVMQDTCQTRALDSGPRQRKFRKKEIPLKPHRHLKFRDRVAHGGLRRSHLLGSGQAEQDRHGPEAQSADAAIEGRLLVASRDIRGIRVFRVTVK